MAEKKKSIGKKVVGAAKKLFKKGDKGNESNEQSKIRAEKVVKTFEDALFSISSGNPDLNKFVYEKDGKVVSKLSSKGGYFDKIFKSACKKSGLKLGAASSVGRWWSKVVKKGASYDKEINGKNIEDVKRMKSTSMYFMVNPISSALNLPPAGSSKNKYSSVNSEEYEKEMNQLLIKYKNAREKLEEVLCFGVEIHN